MAMKVQGGRMVPMGSTGTKFNAMSDETRERMGIRVKSILTQNLRASITSLEATVKQMEAVEGLGGLYARSRISELSSLVQQLKRFENNAKAFDTF